jgi:hypothetical protein
MSRVLPTSGSRRNSGENSSKLELYRARFGLPRRRRKVPFSRDTKNIQLLRRGVSQMKDTGTGTYSEGLGSNCYRAKTGKKNTLSRVDLQSGKHPDMDGMQPVNVRGTTDMYVESTCATTEWRSHIYGGEDPTLVMGVEKGMTWVVMYLFESLPHGKCPKAQKPPDRCQLEP